MQIPSAAVIAAKWLRVTSGRGEDYEKGVRNPQRDWKNETVAATDRYIAGLKTSFLRNAFAKGVEKVGTAKQKAKSILKGIPRWSEGVMYSEEDMRKGMEGVVNVLKALELPKRYETGDPRNLERVKVIMEALHKMKIGA